MDLSPFKYAVGVRVKVFLAGNDYVGIIKERLDSRTGGVRYAVYAHYRHASENYWFSEKELARWNDDTNKDPLPDNPFRYECGAKVKVIHNGRQYEVPVETLSDDGKHIYYAVYVGQGKELEAHWYYEPTLITNENHN